MDGDIKPASAAPSAAADIVAREAVGAPAGAAVPPKTLRWLAIVGLLLALVLGGLYGFNKFRERSIATFFANNKPPPAQISAVVAETAAVPRYAPGIGSLAAVHQVTVTPEIGGRVSGILFSPGAEV